MSPPRSAQRRRSTGHWHNDRVSTEAPAKSSGAQSRSNLFFRRPNLLFFPVIVVAIGLHALLADSFDFRVLPAGAILAVGCAVGLNAERTAPYAFGLPGLTDGPPAASKVSPRVYPLVSTIMIAAFVVLQVFDVQAGASLALAAFALTAWVIASDPVLRRVWQTRKVTRALLEYVPTIGMGFAGRSGGPWQLHMWEPYLLRSGERCVIFNVHEKYAEMILEGGDLTAPFVQLGSDFERDLDDVLVPSLKALFYVQNAQSNAAFMNHRRITHVWLNHGDSDKPANFNPRHALYDRLVVCGQAGIDRYANHGIEIPQEKFDVLGRPQATGINRARGRIGSLDKPIVFYGPTWQGLESAVNFSSLDRGPELVRELIRRDVTVVFRPHPLSYRWRNRRAVVREIHDILRNDRIDNGRKHILGRRADKTWSVVDCCNAADALISDVSSIVSDFLQSEKPYAMMSMRAPVEEFRTEFSVAETGYVILGDLSNLDAMLDNLLGADPLAEARAARKRYVLGDFTGEESADAFAEYVRGLVRRTS